MPITTPQDLREHLKLAIQVELSTVPPYLYAMYSIEDEGSTAAKLIRSVVAEEMLHAALAANVLLAVGGRPGFASAEMIPRYPSELAHHHPPLHMRLEPCSPALVRDLFLVIERPEVHEAPPQADQFETLGQFYHALEIAMTELADSHDLFADPQAESQMGDPSFYSPVTFDAEDSGGLMTVTDLQSAHAAIEIIVHQGEGLSDDKWADPLHQELTHYHKFLQIVDGVAPIGEVRPALTNPRTADFPEEVRPVSDLFNAVYRYVFVTMDEIFSPRTDKAELVGRLYRLMADVLSPVARYLMTQRIDDHVAGPTFEVYDLGETQPHERVVSLAADVARVHPQLGAIVTALSRP
jgi:hypothetical protein